MKRVVRYAIVLLVLGTSFAASAQEFTGDTKTACEVILCLSTGQRPSECDPPIRKYFSITAKKLSDTIKKRKNFLKLCPTADQDDNMRKLVDDIANGAGRCDASSLNASLRVWRDHDSGQMVIRNTLPSYCSAYANNAYTDQTISASAKYVGDPEHGGYWVDADKYDEALAAYNKQQEQANWNNNGGAWNNRR